MGASARTLALFAGTLSVRTGTVGTDSASEPVGIPAGQQIQVARAPADSLKRAGVRPCVMGTPHERGICHAWHVDVSILIAEGAAPSAQALGVKSSDYGLRSRGLV
ncbi:hypothetical protein [Corynebacterium sp. LK30]|uniref:hypothetical protein n=1 Tax=Corynebacterium sp. LK30 TaxID=2044577 RepID=UPI00165236BA|nr:hypothetical protein [Corynebacterium sp. LK30]